MGPQELPSTMMLSGPAVVRLRRKEMAEPPGKLKTTILPSPEHQLQFCSPEHTKKLELEKVHSILLHQFH